MSKVIITAFAGLLICATCADAGQGPFSTRRGSTSPACADVTVAGVKIAQSCGPRGCCSRRSCQCEPGDDGRPTPCTTR
jgi:hypothetical protein